MGLMLIRSIPLLDEMRTVTVSEGSIGAEGGGKDDRVIASALAHVGWTDWVRRRMIGNGQTYEVEMSAAAKRAEGLPTVTLQQSIVQDFFARKAEERLDRASESKWR